MRTWFALWRHRRRAPATTPPQVLQAEGVVLDLARRRAHVEGYVVHLPAREAAVLGVLMAHAGQVVHIAVLTDAAGYLHRADHRSLDRLVGRLRRRLQPSPLSPARLHRVSTSSYRFGSTNQPDPS